MTPVLWLASRSSPRSGRSRRSCSRCGGYVGQVVGAKHMLFELSGLPVEAIEAKAQAGHPDAQRIYHELTEMSGVVVRWGHVWSGGVNFVIEFPSDWFTQF